MKISLLLLLAGLGLFKLALAEEKPAVSKPVFDILDFQIEGNTLLDDETLERTVYPFMGPQKSVDDVEHARQALENTYRDKGYPTVAVAVPEQDVNEDGAVRLNVVEGEVDILHITGSKYHQLDPIRSGVPALAEGKVPHLPTVQAQLDNLSRQSNDRSVTPIFRAGSTPGKMEVELRVKDNLPLHGSVEINSRNSERTDYLRLVSALRYDNLWQKFHSASLQFQVSPEDSNEVEVWSGTYVLPTGWADTRLAFYGIGISSNTQLGVSVGGATVVGAGTIFGARLVKPLTNGGAFLDNLTVGTDYKSFGQALSLAGQDTGASQINYLTFLSAYDASWRGDSSATSLNVSAHFSVRGLGNDAQEFNARRFGSTPSFLYLTTDVRHQHKLPGDFRLQFKALGQASSAGLISNEQFSAGGPQSVRGYHQTQLLGDHGINVSLEIFSPQLIPSNWENLQSLRLLSFFDWAGVWIDSPSLPTQAFSELSSAGLGLRVNWFKKLTGELDWGYPFNKQGLVSPGKTRLDIRIVYEF